MGSWLLWSLEWTHNALVVRVHSHRRINQQRNVKLWCSSVNHRPLFKSLSLFLPHSFGAKASQCLLTFDCSEILSLPLRWTFGVINKSLTGTSSYRLSDLFLLLLPPITLNSRAVFILFRQFQVNLKVGLCLFDQWVLCWTCMDVRSCLMTSLCSFLFQTFVTFAFCVVLKNNICWHNGTLSL